MLIVTLTSTLRCVGYDVHARSGVRGEAARTRFNLIRQSPTEVSHGFRSDRDSLWKARVSRVEKSQTDNFRSHSEAVQMFVAEELRKRDIFPSFPLRNEKIEGRREKQSVAQYRLDRKPLVLPVIALTRVVASRIKVVSSTNAHRS